MSKVRILSLDGGGLRGIIPLLILKKIEEQQGKKIHELFDIIVGTSTGGIIACGLTCTKDGVNPYLTVDKLIDLYTKNGGVIFPYKKNIFSKIIKGANSIFNPKFSPDGLDGLLTQYFGDLKLSNTLKPIVVTSYDLRNNEIVMFKSRKSNEPECDVLLKDVCRATSAAPTYLPSYEMNYNGKNRVCIDGGVFINNPSMAAVAEVLKWGIDGADIKLKDISCLSLGTGMYTDNLGVKNTPSWGVVNWAQPITTVMMQSTSAATVYECEQVLSNFLRLQVTIDDKDRSDMSDSRKETLDYITSRVNDQIINNSDIQKSIVKFFK
jgi:patatin-like phospholipase/acyl hydrolase